MTRPLRLLLSLCCLALLPRCAHERLPEAPAPVVATDHGSVMGQPLEGGGGAFLGIPYAAPPTGAKRWRPPEPAAAWSGVRDATRLGKPCPQVNPFTRGKLDFDEDCLTLNVWTPSLTAGARAPVMVFIHGGGFTFGTAGEELYSGAPLSRGGAVVVTMNYRLGALGFLAHPALSAEEPVQPHSGNYGLMDQQQALRWVHDNIARFGGNPENVTVFGESAGAISACLHLVSPQAKGLFQRAILQSGTCYLTTTPLHDPGTPDQEDSAEERGLRFAKELGCTGGDVAACLRAKSPADLLAASGVPLDVMRPLVSFSPNVDGYVLPAQPRQLLAEGRYTKVPVMTGTNADEGTLFTLRAKLDSWEDYEQAVRARSPTRAEQLLKLYPVKSFASPRDEFNHLMRDILFLCPSRVLARTVTKDGQPVYAYQFTYVPGGFINSLKSLGSMHAAELPFVFGATKGALKIDSEPEKALSSKMIGYWTRFATASDPNGGGAPTWPAYKSEADPHLELGKTIAPGDHLDQAHCDGLETFVF